MTHSIEQSLSVALRKTVPMLRGSLESGQGGESSKEDGSIYTDTDVASELSIVEDLERLIDLPLIGEEGGRVGNYTGNQPVVFIDPQDGTVSGRMRSTTATAGASVWDPTTKSWQAGVVVDPFGGREWYTEGERSYRQNFDVYTLHSLGEKALSRVSLDGEGVVLIDTLSGFTRTDVFSGENRLAIRDDEKFLLLGDIQQKLGKIGTVASNLHAQSLVAEGGAVIASVTSALGGPWDLSGVPIILNAGGEARYLRRTGDGIEEIDDIVEADMAISANSKHVADQLVDSLARSIKHRA